MSSCFFRTILDILTIWHLYYFIPKYALIPHLHLFHCLPSLHPRLSKSVFILLLLSIFNISFSISMYQYLHLQIGLLHIWKKGKEKLANSLLKQLSFPLLNVLNHLNYPQLTIELIRDQRKSISTKRLQIYVEKP